MSVLLFNGLTRLEYGLIRAIEFRDMVRRYTPKERGRRRKKNGLNWDPRLIGLLGFRHPRITERSIIARCATMKWPPLTWDYLEALRDRATRDPIDWRSGRRISRSCRRDSIRSRKSWYDWIEWINKSGWWVQLVLSLKLSMMLADGISLVQYFAIITTIFFNDLLWSRAYHHCTYSK